MDLAGGDEEEGALFHGLAGHAVEEGRAAPGDDVALGAIVGLLGVVALGGIELHLQRGPREDGDGEVAGRGRALGQGFQEADVNRGQGETVTGPTTGSAASAGSAA